MAFGPFVLDVAQVSLSRDGERVALSGRPFSVLALLVSRAGTVVDKGTLLDEVWGHRHVGEAVLKVAVNVARAALGDDAKAPHFIETVPRCGYRFLAEVTEFTASPVAGNLPRTPALVGREADAACLHALLDANRLVTLRGLGGVGKTQLALAVAAGRRERDGAWLVRLDAGRAGENMATCIARAIRLGPDAGTSQQHLCRALESRHQLLVLDNAEHRLNELAALVPDLLRHCPGLRLLVTSQSPLRVSGECVLPLAPLALPQQVADPAPLPQSYAAARLFCERVRQCCPGYQPAAAEHGDIAAICRALDGVPLAIELAAARVPLLGMAEIRRRLDQRFSLLTRGARDVAARQRSLSAALDWTYGLLEAREQSALHVLARLPSAFTLEAAERALAGEPAHLDLIEALCEWSLVVVEPTDDVLRLRLFDSVRHYVLGRIEGNGPAKPGRETTVTSAPYIQSA
ncbi:ATP-binding protein [Roseateles sp.]|uniref:ATP-binding protein n=1 Tax=Roseateles sp. TaxID=1971397 RepID=UPI0039EC2861